MARRSISYTAAGSKHLRRHVFGLFPAAHAARYVRVHTVKVQFVELREAARIALGRFDQKTLFLSGRLGLQRSLRKPPSSKSNRRTHRKVTRARIDWPL
jgi:hypothetical protein